MCLRSVDTVAPLSRVWIKRCTLLWEDIVVGHTQIYRNDVVRSYRLAEVEDLRSSAGALVWVCALLEVRLTHSGQENQVVIYVQCLPSSPCDAVIQSQDDY